MSTETKIKLSHSQKKVIKLLKEGKRLHWITGIHARCFFESDKRNISWATIFKLEKMKLIGRTDGINYISLTELGKSIEL